MQTIACLCVEKEVAHESHARSSWCANGRTLWWKDHEGDLKPKFLLAQNERRRKTLCAHLHEMPKHQVGEWEKIWAI